MEYHWLTENMASSTYKKGKKVNKKPQKIVLIIHTLLDS